MIAISSAVSSSISSISAGMVSSPARRRRAPAALAGDQLEPRPVERADEDRLEHAMLTDGGGQLIERRLVEGEPRLLGVRLDAVDSDDAHADRPDRPVGAEQADDGGGELTILGQSPRGRGSEIRPGQGRSPPVPARGRCGRHRSWWRTT